jgi:hypothetical protein
MPRSLVFHFLLVGLALPALVGSQLDGRLYLSKRTYSAGEPVFLIFEVKNKGTEPVMIGTADPLSFCGGYKIEVEGVKSQESFGCYGGVLLAHVFATCPHRSGGQLRYVPRKACYRPDGKCWFARIVRPVFATYRYGQEPDGTVASLSPCSRSAHSGCVPARRFRRTGTLFLVAPWRL